MTRTRLERDPLKGVPLPKIRNRALFGVTVLAAFASVLSAGSAKAAANTTCAAPTDLVFGDKTISNLVCTGVGPATEIVFNGIDLAYNFGAQIDPPTRMGSISYTISVNDPTKFAFSTVGLDSTCIFPSLTTGCIVTKEVTSGGALLTSLVSTNGSNAGPFVLPGSLSSLGIKDLFTATGSSAVSQVNNFFEQKPARAPGDVPGPLPVLGAGAAFGFSRKLRSRIKKASSVA